MSKFFGAVGESDSSETSSSEESEEEVEEIKEEVKQKTTKADRAMLSDDESSDEEERKILTPATKMRDALRKVISPINTAIKDKDFAALHTGFNELVKELNKNSDVIQQSGEPNFLLKTLMKMEDLINSIRSVDEKNMAKNNKKNFGTLKNKFKKFIKADYEEKLAEYRKDPKDSEAEEEDEDEDEDEDEEEVSKPATK